MASVNDGAGSSKQQPLLVLGKISGLSAPVLDSAADIVGAITISGPTIRMPREQWESWVDLLVGYAEQVTRTIGGRVPQ